MDNQDLIPLDVFCIHHHIENTFIDELAENGLIEIVYTNEKRFIPELYISDLEKFVRFHYDLKINMEGIATIVHLLERMEALQQEIRSLRNKLDIYNLKE